MYNVYISSGKFHGFFQWDLAPYGNWVQFSFAIIRHQLGDVALTPENYGFTSPISMDNNIPPIAVSTLW